MALRSRLSDELLWWVKQTVAEGVAWKEIALCLGYVTSGVVTCKMKDDFENFIGWMANNKRDILANPQNFPDLVAVIGEIPVAVAGTN